MPRLKMTMLNSSSRSQRLMCSPGWRSFSTVSGDDARREEADHADDQRAQEGTAEAADVDADREQRRHPEHDGVHYQREQAQRQQRQRKRQQQDDRSQEGIQHTEDEREQQRPAEVVWVRLDLVAEQVRL